MISLVFVGSPNFFPAMFLVSGVASFPCPFGHAYNTSSVMYFGLSGCSIRPFECDMLGHNHGIEHHFIAQPGRENIPEVNQDIGKKR